jgi:hypothetical protein
MTIQRLKELGVAKDVIVNLRADGAKLRQVARNIVIGGSVLATSKYVGSKLLQPLSGQ